MVDTVTFFSGIPLVSEKDPRPTRIPKKRKMKKWKKKKHPLPPTRRKPSGIQMRRCIVGGKFIFGDVPVTFYFVSRKFD